MVAIDAAMLSITARKSAICSSVVLGLGGGGVMGLGGGVVMVNREGRVGSVLRQRRWLERQQRWEALDTKMLWLRRIGRERSNVLPIGKIFSFLT
jgi:hypothetical protein